MFIGHDKGKSVLRAAAAAAKRRKNRTVELNIYKFYVANVLYRGAAFLFHAAVRICDCVTFYFNFMLFSNVYEPDQFFIKQKKVFGKEEKPKKILSYTISFTVFT